MLRKLSLYYIFNIFHFIELLVSGVKIELWPIDLGYSRLCYVALFLFLFLEWFTHLCKYR